MREIKLNRKINWEDLPERWFKTEHSKPLLLDVVSFIEWMGVNAWAMNHGEPDIDIRKKSYQLPLCAEVGGECRNPYAHEPFKERWNKSLGMKHYYNEDTEAIDYPEIITEKLMDIQRRKYARRNKEGQVKYFDN